MRRQNVEKHPKNQQNLLLFGGKFKTWGEGISPPKALKKKKHCSLVTDFFIACIIVLYRASTGYFLIPGRHGGCLTSKEKLPP